MGWGFGWRVRWLLKGTGRIPRMDRWIPLDQQIPSCYGKAEESGMFSVLAMVAFAKGCILGGSVSGCLGTRSFRPAWMRKMKN